MRTHQRNTPPNIMPSTSDIWATFTVPIENAAITNTGRQKRTFAPNDAIGIRNGRDMRGSWQGITPKKMTANSLAQTFHRKIKKATNIMELTRTVRMDAAVAKLLNAVPPPLTWYLKESAVSSKTLLPVIV